jgi:hypothetical protein
VTKIIAACVKTFETWSLFFCTHIVMEVNYKQHLCASHAIIKKWFFSQIRSGYIHKEAIVGIIQTSRLTHVLGWGTF